MEKAMTGHRIIKNLTKRGNSVLGVGVYSAALSASNGVDAIKIGTNIDDPWLDFKALVIDAMPSNNHLPRIKSFYFDAKSEFYVCVMERLESIKIDNVASKLVDACKEFVEGYHSDEEFVGIAEEYSTLVPNTTELLTVLKTIKQYTTHIKYGQPVGISTSEYNCEDFEQDYEGRRLDMHRGNFMLDCNGVLVVTDPWCNVDMDEISDLSVWAETQISESWNN
jgi:hypothetical protein